MPDRIAMEPDMSLAIRVLKRLGRREVRPYGALGTQRAMARSEGPISFADLSEMPSPRLLPPLDRPNTKESELSAEQLAWRRDGVVILRNFVPEAILDRYIARRALLQIEAPECFRGGWRSPTPYEHLPELRRLCLYPPLMHLLKHLIGEPMMLHLTLTGWVSTERNWHQDDYLNPPFVNSWYTAVWIALDHIDPASGPFEYVPGSAAWPLMRREKVLACMAPQEAEACDPLTGALLWPSLSERFVTPAIETEIAARNGRIERFLGEKGDVLIWHGRLMHRGSRPQSPDLLRKALIAHYSGVNHRADMPGRKRDENGMSYAVFGHPLV